MVDLLYGRGMNFSFQHTGYLLLYFAVLVEGPVATFAGATLAASGTLQPAYSFLAICTGNMSGDIAWYLIGHAGRFADLRKRLPGLQQFDRQLDEIKGKIKQHPRMILLSGKLWFGVAAIPALIGLGMARVEWQKLLPVLVCCEILWSGTLFTIGYLLAGSLPLLSDDWQNITSLAAASLVAATLPFLYGKFLQKKRGTAGRGRTR